MTSRFDAPGEKRPFCVVPVRALADKRMKDPERRVLMALGHYANRAGVCWPSVRTLASIAGVEENTVLACVPRLLEANYIRQLNPNDYDQKPGVWGHSNRYQVLWKGDEPVPTWEEVRDANLLQPYEDRDATSKGSGARGTPEQQALADRHTTAFQAGVEAALGWRPTQVAADPAWRLASLAADPAATRLEAEKMARALAAERRGAPQFAEIAALIAGRINLKRRDGENTGVEGAENSLGIAGKRQRDLSKARAT